MARSIAEIDTGLSSDLGRHCWQDETHVIVLRRTHTADRDDQTEGVYVLDVTRPREVARLDLAPISVDAQRGMVGLSCQDQAIVMYHFSPTNRQMRETYTMALGSAPERLSELRGAEVSVKGRYILGNSAKVISDGGPFQGTFEGNDACDVRYVRPGFRVLCWDSFLLANQPLTKFVLSEYRWRESIKVRSDQGTKHVPNPATPLQGKDGKPLLYGLHLRDFSGKILANLNDDPKYAPWVDYGLPMTPDESYVYAACSERANPIGLAHIVCRYRLDGQQHDWEEVFRSDLVKRLKASIVKLSVSQPGDVYFLLSANGSNGGIWRFDAQSKSINQVVANTFTHLNSAPSISPDGKWLLYIRSGRDGAKLMLLPTGAR